MNGSDSREKINNEEENVERYMKNKEEIIIVVIIYLECMKLSRRKLSKRIISNESID